MRRSNFFIGVLVALGTYVALSTFVRRPWGWQRGWRYHHCYYEGRHRYNDDRNERPNTNPQPLTDSTNIQ